MSQIRSSPYSTNANKEKQKAPPRKKACQNCTKSKVRCGLEKPICSRCRSKGHSCQYPPGRVAAPQIGVTGTANDIGEDYTALLGIQGFVDSAIVPAPASLIPESGRAAASRSPRPRAVTSGQTRRLDLDFTDIDLTPSLNAVDIRDRWLRPYLLPPLGRDEILKAYHLFTLQYISITLRTYPQYMVKDGGFPPIIHHTQVNTNQMPQALANCYSLVRMWVQAAPGSETMVMSAVEAEMERLASETTSQHDYDLLCSFQAYLVYTILMYFSPLGNVSAVTDKIMMTLMELAFRTAQNGLLCTAETTHTRPNWESWIVVSAKRRAIYTMYLLTSVYNSDRGLPNFVADEMKGVYVPESKVLWEVTDREVWEKEYDRHLLEWEDGMLEISELWRSTETGSTERRERIGRWVRGVDEFDVYITDHAPSVLQTHSWRTASNSAAYLVPYIKPSMKILDIGCGPGSISIDFARLVPQGHVTAIEYVADPLDAARSLASAHGLTNIDFRVGDIHSLDFPDDTFDIVHVHQVLQHIADPVRALREMRRVAKSDGGIVAARESASMTWYPDNAGIAGWKEVTDRMCKAKGSNPHPGRYIHVWAEEAGFQGTRIKKSAGAWCFSSPEERKYWGGSMEARMRSSGFSKMAVEEGYATKEELETIANGWRDFVKDDQAWFGLLHGEILCWK
ncbi:hypothetical protein ACP6JE_008886 [Aspergillus fumigatus]